MARFGRERGVEIRYIYLCRWTRMGCGINRGIVHAHDGMLQREFGELVESGWRPAGAGPEYHFGHGIAPRWFYISSSKPFCLIATAAATSDVKRGIVFLH